MIISSEENNGLKVPLSVYRKLKAFQSGGFYWDHQPQDVIRQFLGDQLPRVEVVDPGDGPCGLFRRHVRGKERLWKAVPAGGKAIPPDELKKLEENLAKFHGAASAEETQPHNRELISQFRLPDPETDPELYLLRGPWWDRKLEVLWGCEKVADSSIAPSQAVKKLKADNLYYWKQIGWLILGTLALLILLWLLSLLWALGKKGFRKMTNDRPVASAVIAQSDPKERAVELDLSGAVDPDGQIREQLIDWGNGDTEVVPAGTKRAKKKYDKDGVYPISVTAIDDLGDRSEPASRPITFDDETKAKKAKEAADRAKEAEAQRLKEAADREAEAARQKALQDKINAAKEEERRLAEEREIAAAREKARQEAEAELRKKTAEANQPKVSHEEANPAPPPGNSSAQDAQSKQGAPQASSSSGGETGFRDVVTGKNVRPKKWVAPRYPSSARAQRIEGSVKVEFEVDEAGKPQNIVVVSSTNGRYFEKAVVDAIAKSTFEPAEQNGTRERQRVTREIVFEMKD